MNAPKNKRYLEIADNSPEKLILIVDSVFGKGEKLAPSEGSISITLKPVTMPRISLVPSRSRISSSTHRYSFPFSSLNGCRTKSRYTPVQFINKGEADCSASPL